MTAEELRKELFKLGLSFDVFSSRDRSYIVLSGLNESLEPGVELFEKVLAYVEPDEEALSNMIDGMLKERQDAMKSKGQILFNAMSQYAQYGTDNPLKNILSEEELSNIKPEELVSRLKEITSYEHMIYYYGPQDYKDAMATIDKYHKVPAEMKPYPEPKEFETLPIDENKVYFVDYDMVQSELLMTAKGPQFDAELAPEVNLFNQYFGSGLSSIVLMLLKPYFQGTISRIVPRLPADATSIARADVDTVVTEHGVAELKHKTIEQRAEALISIADPRFRDALSTAWQDMRKGF